MYRTIYVPVDNSEHSRQAVSRAVELGRAFDAGLVGCHVYSATMHESRFKQMESTLPDAYLEESELERQRKIHDSLISMGLRLISECYLDAMRVQCVAADLAFEPKLMDGKHHEVIVQDIRDSDYDLTLLGAYGLGRSRDSQIGSVCERVTRESPADVWIVKHLPGADETRETILVGLDGSPRSYGALATAFELAERFDKRVEAVAVYDPYLHASVFHGIVDVLTGHAAEVFRFEEQNQLHEEIIDDGLARIYQSHLDVAGKLADARGIELVKTLLDGKAYQKILDHARRIEPWLLVLGRIGLHSATDDPRLGSNAENLLRSCPCDLLLTTRVEHPEPDVRAEAILRWTPEAEQRMQRVPEAVRGMARTAVQRHAVEQGHTVVTSDVLEQVMQRAMPRSAANRTARLAEALAIEQVRGRPVSICKTCGTASIDADPECCSTCRGRGFERVTEAMLEKIAGRQGGLEAERVDDGLRIPWSLEAKRVLWTLKDASCRRRAKVRAEKRARARKLATIPLELAREAVEEERPMPEPGARSEHEDEDGS